jgi:DNA-binding beta-propeller fold protein YncE
MMQRVLAVAVLAVSFLSPGRAQSVGATFGEVIQLGGTPSDIVLDEARGRLYLVNTSANRVDIYDYNERSIAGSFPTGLQPLAAAISMDAAYLYVSNNGTSTLTVIDLNTNLIAQTVTLPAKPEGVEVGVDGRVLITTEGTGSNSLNNTLLMFDPTQTRQNQVQPVQFPPPPPTPTGIPTVLTRIITNFRGKLIRTPDGRFIVGLSTVNNNTQTVVFLYESLSGTILKTRTVTGQSTTLSMSPDGSRFMAGFTLYDTQSLDAVAQQSPANMPFLFSGSFNTLQNVGGSAFTADGATLYSAFNAAPFTQPATRPQASTLLISDPGNLSVKLGIKIPESIVAKMVITSDGANAFGLSESGMIYLPLSTLYDYPILQPETTQVFLAVDDCNKGIARATVRINNLGKGKLTFSVPNLGAALVAQISSGVAPSTVTFVIEPGRSGVTRQYGTNLYTGAATNTGTPINVSLASLEAINIPNTIRIYMNYRNSDQRGQIFPIPTTPNSTTEGLRDLALDEYRNRLYIANSGYNRIEVFDTKNQRFLSPIPVGQLPHQMAIATDGATMYVGNAGGESISIVDLDLGREIGQVEFPPIPRAGNAAITAPATLAYGLSGLQFIMSDGTQWKVVAGTATLRPTGNANTIVPATIPTPQVMLATPGYDYIFTLAGNGTAYLYNALIDTYTSQRQLFTNPIQSYYGPLSASTDSAYFMANGLILNSSLTVIGGAERPGTIQLGPPPGPGQPPTQTVVSGGERNIAATAAMNESVFLRLTTPVRQNITSVTRDEVRTTLEALDVRSNTDSLIGIVPENPVTGVFGTQRSNVPPRQMVVDSKGTAYAITISGLSVIPTTPAGSNTRPSITGGARGIVNSETGASNFKPGSFITVTGQNLASPAVADTLPPPTILGGSCVVFNDVALPLLQASPNQISAQIPENLVRPGLNVVQVRSLAMAQRSDPVVVTVQRP